MSGARTHQLAVGAAAITPGVVHSVFTCPAGKTTIVKSISNGGGALTGTSWTWWVRPVSLGGWYRMIELPTFAYYQTVLGAQVPVFWTSWLQDVYMVLNEGDEIGFDSADSATYAFGCFGSILDA